MIEWAEVVVRFGRRTALDALTLSVGPGVNLVVGPNGAGKTTLFRTLVEPLRPTSGQVLIDGEPITPEASHRIGWLPQNPVLAPRFTAAETLAYAAWLRGSSWRAARARAAEVLDDVGLADRANDHARALSGGMQRTLSFAIANVDSPDILVLDEPMSGLDPMQRAELRGLVATRGQSATVLVSSHVLADLPEMADRVIVLADGQVRRNVTTAEFIEEAGSDSVVDLEKCFADIVREGRPPR